MKEARPIPRREERRVIAGQKTYLPSKSPLRCYYYAKQDRARWSTADRSVQGMRWNYYMLKGRTPLFSHIEHDHLPPAAQRMREIAGRSPKVGETARRAEDLPKAGHKAGSKIPEAPRAGIGRGREPGGHPEKSVIPISRHPEFRHLRVVSPDNKFSASVVPIGSGRSPGSAIGAPGQSRQVPVTVSASFPLALFAQASVEERAENTCAAAPVITMAKATHESQEGQLQPEEFRVHIIRTPDIRAEPARDAAPAQPVSVFLIVPGNDNARPGGPDEPQHIGAAAEMPRVSFSVAPRGTGKKIGYISSPQKKVAQLKLASGAASVPQ